MTQASDLGMRPLVAHCNLALAVQLNAAGEAKAAVDHQSIAETSYRTLGMSNFGLDVR